MPQLQIEGQAADEVRIPALVHAALLQRFDGGTHAKLGFESAHAGLGVPEGSQQVNSFQTGGREPVPKHSTPAGSSDMEARNDRCSGMAGCETMLLVGQKQGACLSQVIAHASLVASNVCVPQCHLFGLHHWHTTSC